MKKRLFLMVLLLCCFISTQAIDESRSALDSRRVENCSGEFEIDGISYTITLHDVSVWTCAKFKVASWFK